jgi:bacteriocin-like protein
MKTLEENELSKIVGGDSFWRDLGQFIGGAVGSVVNGYPNLNPVGLPGESTIVYGLIAAAIN